MSTGFVLYDDATARAMEPFALTRPMGEMRAGGMIIRERWERALGTRAAARIGAPHLDRFDELGAPRAAPPALDAGTVIVNSRFAPSLDARIAELAPGRGLVCDGALAAVAIRDRLDAAALRDGARLLEDLVVGTPTKVGGWWFQESWDLIRHLPRMLEVDAAILAAAIVPPLTKGVTALGEHTVAIAPGAYVEPHVVFDTTAGAVVIATGARIGAFARIAGPTVIGAHTQVAGGRYSCISIGEHSRICGEMSVVIGSGYSNKGHDGFIGHSILGRWSNLGAGTITSNLKNTYGQIRVQDSRGEHETGLQFLGSLIGDHAKTAIGTRLTTGTIIGAGANVFGDGSPAKYVRPFAWGEERYEREKFLDVAAHVMHRREITMSEGTREALGRAWERAKAPRPKAHAPRSTLQAPRPTAQGSKPKAKGRLRPKGG